MAIPAGYTLAPSAFFYYTDGSGPYNISQSGTPQLVGGAMVFANPTGTIGLTANNGTAETATRSDSTHAINQAITPTWTGLHTFTQPLFLLGAADYMTIRADDGVELRAVPAAGKNLLFDVLTGSIVFKTNGHVEAWRVNEAGQLLNNIAGNGISIKEGANAKQGVATLVAGTVVVSNTSVTAVSRIHLTAQTLGTVIIPSALGVSARTPTTSFTILASQVTDTSIVAYEIFEPS